MSVAPIVVNEEPGGRHHGDYLYSGSLVAGTPGVQIEGVIEERTVLVYNVILGHNTVTALQGGIRVY